MVVVVLRAQNPPGGTRPFLLQPSLPALLFSHHSIFPDLEDWLGDTTLSPQPLNPQTLLLLHPGLRAASSSSGGGGWGWGRASMVEQTNQ